MAIIEAVLAAGGTTPLRANADGTLTEQSGIISTVSATVGTAGVAVPAGTRCVYMDVPLLATGTHTPAYIVDNATWVPFALEDLINGAPMPTTSIVAARWGFQRPYVDSNTKVRVTSTGDQTDKPIQVVFCR